MLRSGGGAVIMTVLLGNLNSSYMTDKDEELILLLTANAREPVAALARKLKVSRTTVQDRLRRLEEQGVIAGYTVKLSSQIRSSGISALVTICVEPRRQIDVAKTIAKILQVETLHTVSGKYDLIANVKTATSEDMDRIIDQIGLISGVTAIETAVILSTKLDRRNI
jgi:DNA-binding Lrp family transcriptional regulator